MAFCEKCGTKLEEGIKFCPSCGAPAASGTSAPRTQQSNGQTDLSGKLSNLNNTSDTTAQFDQNDITNNKAMCILAYFGPLCFIPMFAAKDSKFARFHANQGLILFIACVAWGIAYGILSSIILAISLRLFFLVSIIGFLSLVFLVLAIIGILNAVNGKAKELPVIGRFKILK